MKNNTYLDKLHWIYWTGVYLIAALPLLVMPPWFFPVDWGKTIIFRIILSIIIFLFIYQLLYRKIEFDFPRVKKNKIIWVLALFLLFYLLSTLFSQDIGFSLWGSPYRSGGAIDFVFISHLDYWLFYF